MPDRPTYLIELYDHEAEPDGKFSAELAREVLEGPNTGLVRQQLAQALRKVRSLAWDDVSIYVQRENPLPNS